MEHIEQIILFSTHAYAWYKLFKEVKNDYNKRNKKNN